jgi:hypothetical protein
MNKKRKPYQEMNADELAEATKKYDKEFVADEARPLKPAERKLFEAMRKRGAGTPFKQGGSKKMIVIDHSPLKKSDALWRKSRAHRKAS